MTAGQLADLLDGRVADPDWLAGAVDRVARDPDALAALFPAAGRRCGRGPLSATAPASETGDGVDPAGWTVDDAARVLLLTALPLSGAALAEQVEAVYRYGSADEKRAVLRALPLLDIGAGGVEILHDAIRTNDTRLVAAAVGPYARHLDAAMWRQAVLKCVFMDIPLTAVDGLDRRADGELGRMLGDLADERRAAGRTMPADADILLALIGDLPPEA
ncbi:EboA domain-containing protein [Actinacidiphila bryophytorum]|uniref:EboA domain-containing protein n=1 Tax=Actinacidiphila bryophytorum TaxID=1436133 RepID=UPI002176B257|nr:EboA domain-containing protein [Actinacidiphila bryophytorum]UWE13961.1 EboA domain-containing protein [Actinacidiphila bryophytorum]